MKILANDGVSQAGVDMLEDAGHEVMQTKVAQEQLAKYINDNNVEVILVRSATKVRKDLIDACPNLKIIGRGGVGLDNIDVDYAKSKNIHVINTPAASSDSVAELVMAHALGGFRFLHQANREMPLEGESKFKDLKKSFAKGVELKGKTMGIVGMGRIGQAVAKRAIGLGMKVVAHDKFADEADVKIEFFDGQNLTFKLKSIDFDDLLAQSDVITFHVPAQKGYILGKAEIEKMKDGAAVINTARGGVLDEVAVVEALESGKLKFAALDVFEKEPTPEVKLLMQPQLSLSPHIGGATNEAQSRIGTELAQQIIDLS
jgi:D-3-phosphoglycerate dehydrogenase